MDPSQSSNPPPEAHNSSEQSGMPAAAPLAYQYIPAGYPLSFPSHPVLQSPYVHGLYPGQPMVTVQPPVIVTAAPRADPVPDYLPYSIFSMLCCCWPFLH